jgi:hypothetical protein
LTADGTGLMAATAVGMSSRLLMLALLILGPTMALRLPPPRTRQSAMAYAKKVVLSKQELYGKWVVENGKPDVLDRVQEGLPLTLPSGRAHRINMSTRIVDDLKKLGDS